MGKKRVVVRLILEAGRGLTAEDVQRLQQKLDQVRIIGNELGGILNPEPDEQADLDKVQEQLEELSELLGGAAENNSGDGN